MGAYQELVLTCNLKEDCPQQVIDILNYFFRIDRPITDDIKIPDAPDHPFFVDWGSEYWWFYGQEPYYFPGERFAKLTKDTLGFYKLTLRTMIKWGYDTVKNFLDWIAPYSRTEGFVGYTRNDEVEQIDLIYFENGAVFYTEVKMWPEPPTINRRKISK
jgi:hypothetical protein